SALHHHLLHPFPTRRSSDLASKPGACITVDSEDRTYLVGRGLVPTSNTQLMAFSAYQYAQEGRPVIVIDPKPGSDLRESFKDPRSEEHTSELQSRFDLVCRL